MSAELLSRSGFVPLDVPGKLLSVASFRLQGEAGVEEHMVIASGEIGGAKPILVRLHSGCITGDVFGSSRCDCGWQLKFAVDMIEREGGLVVYSPHEEGRGHGLFLKVVSFAAIDEGVSVGQVFTSMGLQEDVRHFSGQCAILQYLGVRSLRLITNNPRKISAAENAGLVVVERVAVVMPVASCYSRRYLEEKAQDLGHLIDARGNHDNVR